MNETELPKWQCHKVVHALKINVVEYMPDDMVMLQFHDTRFAPIQVSTIRRPKPSNDWYYVVYPDGYFSFSPTKEFEDGYTLIGPKVRPNIAELEAILASEEDIPITINPDGSITAG